MCWPSIESGSRFAFDAYAGRRLSPGVVLRLTGLVSTIFMPNVSLLGGQWRAAPEYDGDFLDGATMIQRGSMGRTRLLLLLLLLLFRLSLVTLGLSSTRTGSSYYFSCSPRPDVL